ncbi:hypothetical protein HU200_067514 [Digitaria exilis]|uniref:Uncharacterized protein n=1 Tax=Digitaria exilis TaxID=1010633 RepID=A0A834ZUL5_9POAL|nr:hypothetical protein HU200_067514 [Digitaria exilis]
MSIPIRILPVRHPTTPTPPRTSWTRATVPPISARLFPVPSSTCRYLLPAGLHRGIRDSPRMESDPPSLTQPLPLPDGLNGVRSGMRSWGMVREWVSPPRPCSAPLPPGARARTTTAANNDPQKLCLGASDRESCAKVIESIPGIQAANTASNISDFEAPAPTTTGLNNNDPQKLCLGASDRESCAKVIESIPGIQAANTAGNISDLCLHFAANKTTEAKALADTVLAATKGKAPYCLEACAKNVSSMADVLVDLPAKQDDMNAYLTAKNFRAKFKHEDPPICEKDCRNNEAPAPTTTGLNNNDPQKLCLGASDRESCAKVIESIPGIQAANTAGNISDLCLHFAANKTTEAKALADTVLAATKGKAPYCLEACAKNVSSMADVLVDLPAKQDDMNAYLTAKNFRAKFKHEDPPICEKDCRNNEAPAPATTGLNNNDPQKLCLGASDRESCAKVIESIPGIQAANTAGNISDLCLDFAANKTTEAKALADTVLAATKGKAPYCLEACAKNVSSMADVLVDLPAKQDDMNAYLTAKNFRAKFKHEDPPICEKDCRNNEAPAPTTTGLNNNDPQKLCLGASDRESCAKVIESIPGIQAANTAGNISDLCLHFAANKTTEAKALADTVLAATKGKAPYCLEACAKNVSSMADVLVDLPAKQDDMNAYLTAKNFRAKFKHEDPPICEKDCRNNEAPAPTTTGLNNNDPQKLCLGASDRESCAKVIESIPGIQAANTAGNISDLCLHFAANKTTEAKALADTVLAATKGKAPYCLEACAKNVSSMADVLVDLPAKQDDMNAYLTAKNFRAKFKHEDPPICEKDCRNNEAPAPTTTGLNNNDPQKLCLGASDRESCAKVIESIPGIQAANTAGNISDLCLHFAANKTTEAKALADTVLAATKGKAPYCLEACAKNVSSMADVLVDLPAKQDDMNAYLTAKNFRAKFKHEDPPICEKDCRNNEAPAPTTTGLNNNDPQKLCLGASDRESCAKVIESIPGIQAANTAGNISDLCLHFAANKTTEAKALADTVLAATKGKAPYCLEACAKNVSSMADVLVDLPAKQDDMNAYLTAKNFRAKFKHEDPPICEKDSRCSRVPELAAGSPRRRPSSSASTSDTAGCPRSPRTPLASADSALATASPPRTAGPCRRRRCPPVQTATFAPPRALFPRSVASRLAHARLPPAARLNARVDAARGANTAATWLCRRATSPSRSGLHLELPEHPLTPLSRLLKPATVPLAQHAGKTSPELAESPPSSLSCTALPALSSFPNLHCHSPSHSRPNSPTRAPGVARRSSQRPPPPPAHGTFSFLVSRWCSPTPSPSFSDPDVAAATAAVDRVPGHPRPRDLAQTNRGELLSVLPHFPGPVSPPFGRRNHAGEPWT